MSVPSFLSESRLLRFPPDPSQMTVGRFILLAAPREDCAELTALPLRGRFKGPSFQHLLDGRTWRAASWSCTGICGSKSAMMEEVEEYEGNQRACLLWTLRNSLNCPESQYCHL